MHEEQKYEPEIARTYAGSASRKGLIAGVVLLPKIWRCVRPTSRAIAAGSANSTTCSRLIESWRRDVKFARLWRVSVGSEPAHIARLKTSGKDARIRGRSVEGM